jgi:hypothetical protein
MLSEQEKFWIALKGAEHYAHEAGKEMTSVLNAGKRPRYTAMSKIADQHFAVIMQVFDVEQSSRITKTWLSCYQLPFNPMKLKTFDQFYCRHRNVVEEMLKGNIESIRSY